MTAALLCIFLAIIAVINAQTACLPSKFCSNIAAIAGRYPTAQSCITACGAGKWTSYADSTGWCGCASTCATTIPNPGYQTYCPNSPPPTQRPTANPTANPTQRPTQAPTSLNKCYPGQYCSYSMVVYPGPVQTAADCAVHCAAQKFFTYVPVSKWCACAPANGCSANTRVTNLYADSYCL
jgi:hypothetical protein